MMLDEMIFKCLNIGNAVLIKENIFTMYFIALKQQAVNI
jgi:hypothetical protein